MRAAKSKSKLTPKAAIESGTTLTEDGEGEFSVQPGSISHVPPDVKGDPLDIDGNTIAEVRRGLVVDTRLAKMLPC